MIDGYIKEEYYGECKICGKTTNKSTLILYPRGICGKCCCIPEHIPDKQHTEYIRLLLRRGIE